MKYILSFIGLVGLLIVIFSQPVMAQISGEEWTDLLDDYSHIIEHNNVLIRAGQLELDTIRNSYLIERFDNNMDAGNTDQDSLIIGDNIVLNPIRMDLHTGVPSELLDIELLPDGNMLVAAKARHQILLVSPLGAVTEIFGEIYIVGDDATHLNNPNDVDYLADGGLLITDKENRRVFKIHSLADETIEWMIGSSSDTTLAYPTDADMLSNGNVMIVDHAHHQIVEYTTGGVLVKVLYGTGKKGEKQGELNMPEDAQMLDNGNLLITDTGNHRVIEVNPITHALVWQFGETAVSGSGRDHLNNPSMVMELDNGEIMICDRNNNRIFSVRQSDNTIMWSTLISDAATRGEMPLTLDRPQDIVLTSVGRILLIDDDDHIMEVGYMPPHSGVFTSTFQSCDDPNMKFFAQFVWSGNVDAGLTDIDFQYRISGGVWQDFTGSGYTLNFADTTATDEIAFRATLSTTDPLLSPRLDNVRLFWGRYYETGTARSEWIVPAQVNNWEYIEYNAIIPTSAENISMQIMDGGDNTLQTITTSIDGTNRIPLSFGVNQPDSISIIATLTSDGGRTPALLDWRVVWEPIAQGNSSIYFTNNIGNSKETYIFVAEGDTTQNELVYVTLEDFDENVNSALYDSVMVKLTDLTLANGDSTILWLNEINGSNSGIFRNSEGFILVPLSDTLSTGVLRVNEKDTIGVFYVDDDDLTDRSDDTAVLISNPPPPSRINFIIGLIETTERRGRYNTGETVYIMVEDKDQNTNNSVIETMSTAVTLDDERGNEVYVVMREMAIISGVFTGSVVTTGEEPTGNELRIAYDASHIHAHYTDPDDNSDQCDARAEIEPPGIPGPDLLMSGFITIYTATDRKYGPSQAIIKICVKGESDVNIKILDMTGDLCITLPEKRIPANDPNGDGENTCVSDYRGGPDSPYVFIWDLITEAGREAKAGIYFVMADAISIEGERYTQVGKLVLVK